MNKSAINDVMGLAWKLGAWWKKNGLTVLVCTGLGSHGRSDLLDKSKCVLSSEIFNYSRK